MGAPQPAASAAELLDAIREGNAARVAQLLDTDRALLRAKAPDGASSIQAAVYWGHAELVALFEERGALLDLCEACAAGRRARVELLLEGAPTLARQYSEDGYSPLGLAVFFGHDEIAALLLERGADVNAASTNSQRVTPLHAAVARRNAAMVRELLKRGADPNATQAGGFTPLHSAAYHGDREIVEALLAHGADASTETADGKTAAALATERGHAEVAELLAATA